MNWKTRQHQPIQDMIIIADGYMKAVIMLAQDCLQDNVDKKADIVVFPMLFSANHAIELYLKSINWSLDMLFNMKESFCGGHDIRQIWNIVKKRMNYYKNGRGIPAPLLVRRFMGKSTAEELVNEILMLPKMNWNSGDGLYKILPVTLDFAKILSRVAKQDLVVYDKPYDFRYFM